MSLSRRKFINATGIAAAAFGLGGGIFRMPVASASGSKEAAGSNEAKGVLIDITKCIGCHMCSVACRKQNGLAGKSQVPMLKLGPGKDRRSGQRRGKGERHQRAVFSLP